ncbi:hypothetical protein F4801DRAFT_276400 [Xylaria longipes]|nr:hypothetical protein F4801DRAFT_276400 [Xylaria longipes]
MPRLSIPIPWGSDGTRGGLPLALLAVALPAAYMAYVLRQSARRTTASASITPPDPLVGRRPSEAKGNSEAGEDDGGDTLVIIPPAVLAALDNYVISRERIVSEAVPLQKILPDLRRGVEVWQEEADGGKSEVEDEGEGEGEGGRRLLQTYLATTMRVFSWTPQAFAMKSMVSRLPGGAAHADTFSTGYLDTCAFERGDRVCGVYRVRVHILSSRGERILLDLSPPEGWKGPVVSGGLVCGFVVEEKGGERLVRFVNETVMWRRKDEKPTLLEGTVSRWLHTLTVGWMMARGVEAVTGTHGRTKDKTS